MVCFGNLERERMVCFKRMVDLSLRKDGGP